MIVHFDVDKAIYHLLSGDRRELSVTSNTITSISDADKVEILTIKSQSYITRDVLEHFPKLRLIVTRTVGTDHIDTDACEKKGIIVKNIPDYGPAHVAQHTIALMLAGARNIVKANAAIYEGIFDYKPFLGISMSGKTVGVIGTGRIGIEVIRIAKALGMNVLGYDFYKSEEKAKDIGFIYTDLETLLRQSDVVTLHIPATPETKHILNHKTFRLLKSGSILVNTARGDLVDEEALIENIGKFHAVCLDVIENESSFSKDNPLLAFDNVIITPHCAFYSDEAVKTIAAKTEQIISEYTRKK